MTEKHKLPYVHYLDRQLIPLFIEVNTILPF